MTIKKIALSIFLAISMLLSGNTGFAEDQSRTFRIITEEFPPYNYTDHDGKVVGISTEIVREMLKRLDHADNIEVMPWVDGYKLVQE